MSADPRRLDNVTLSEYLRSAIVELKEPSYIMMLAREMLSRHLIDVESMDKIKKSLEARKPRRQQCL